MSAEVVEQIYNPPPLAVVVPDVKSPVYTVEETPIKLDLGCGQNKQEGFLGVDKYEAPGVDVVHDLLEFPWPWADNSVLEVRCSQFFEHIPGRLRPRFMEELWRILKPNHGAVFVTPSWKNERAYGDFTHEWPPVTRWTYLYFSKAWREQNKLTHGAYDINCDFAVTFPAISHDPIWAKTRSHEVLAFAGAHYLDVEVDIFAQVVKIDSNGKT